MRNICLLVYTQTEPDLNSVDEQLKTSILSMTEKNDSKFLEENVTASFHQSDSDEEDELKDGSSSSSESEDGEAKLMTMALRKKQKKADFSLDDEGKAGSVSDESDEDELDAPYQPGDEIEDVAGCIKKRAPRSAQPKASKKAKKVDCKEKNEVDGDGEKEVEDRKEKDEVDGDGEKEVEAQEVL